MKIGNAVLEEEPYCHVLLQEHRSTLCDRCFTSGDSLKKCTGCGEVWYCDKACQKRDWAVHKLECKCLKQVSPKIPMDSVRLMLRLIITKSKDLPMNSPWSRKFDDLMTHSEEIRADKTRTEQFGKMVFTLTEYAGKAVSLPSAAELYDTFCRMVINSFTISDGELKDLGTGIYLSGSMLDHSCKPNAVATFHGCTLVVRATEDIPDPSPNKVFISYVEQLSPVTERQKALKEQYYFDCKCERCVDDEYNETMTSFCCPVQNCDGLVCLTEGNTFKPCRKCGTKDFSPELKKGALAVLDDCKTQLDIIDKEKKSGSSKKVFEKCKKLIQETTNILHPMNVYSVRLLDKAFDVAIEEEHWEKAIKYGQKTLQAYSTYYPKYSPNYAIQLFKVGKLQLYVQYMEDAARNLEQAQSILTVTHGANHDINKNVTLFLNQCREEMRVKSNGS
ncbi:histone-lysine N-methyltransferase SMYD3-like [Ruditapes philippinarum]|uniref:histone-lysine N-methyltransferase SMYD3-like n=1 Tax=Ruditapes philippinarum TaxID=129788 RepID=UPI00295A9EC7|nr:histone-lysine N-methyltransferase SMYD3-like [Ruditapes philippinarum]